MNIALNQNSLQTVLYLLGSGLSLPDGALHRAVAASVSNANSKGNVELLVYLLESGKEYSKEYNSPEAMNRVMDRYEANYGETEQLIKVRKLLEAHDILPTGGRRFLTIGVDAKSA